MGEEGPSKTQVKTVTNKEIVAGRRVIWDLSRRGHDGRRRSDQDTGKKP
jgi:hypothetical protein